MRDIYDTPDGKDCLSKAAETTILGAKIGVIFSALDIMAYSKPATYIGMAGRILHFTAPAAAIGAIFSSASCMAGDFRGKDSSLNHFLGAALSMSVLGIRYGQRTALLAMVPAGLAAALVKQLKMENIKILPDLSKVNKDNGTLYHYKRHFGPRPEVKEPTNY